MIKNENLTIKNMRKIKKIAKMACKVLKLKSIEIRFSYENDFYFSISKKTGKGFLRIDYLYLLQLIKISTELEVNKMYNLNSINKRLKFALYHELGHYLQWQRHTDFFINEYVKEKNRKDKLSPKEYRQLKLEKIADKIALYLLNKNL